MSTIEEAIHNFLTNDDEMSVDDVAELFANSSDIEIAMDIYYNMNDTEYNIVDIEKEVAYLRKTRKYTIDE